MRRDHKRKKVLHKSALMFFYALGIAGTGFVFQDELQTAYEKVQTYASNINLNQISSQGAQGHSQKENVDSTSSVQSVAQDAPASAPAAQTEANVQAESHAQTVTGAQNTPTVQNEPQTHNFANTASVGQAPENTAQANPDTPIQMNPNMHLSNEQALEMFNQLIRAIAKTPVASQQEREEPAAGSTNETLKDGGLTTQSLTSEKLATDGKEGLSTRLSALQEGKTAIDARYTQQLEAVNRAFPWMKVELNAPDNAVAASKEANLSPDSQAEVEQAFKQMNLTRTAGVVKRGCSISDKGCSFVESAQKAGLSKVDISLITQALAGDIELGLMKPGDTFEVVKGVTKAGEKP